MSDYFDKIVVERIPSRNAVIVEFLPSGQKIVSIDCIDGSKKQELLNYAAELLRPNKG